MTRMTSEGNNISTTNFTLTHTCNLSALGHSANIHIIGVCGIAMGQLAMRLSQEGYSVTGSDKEFYHPMAGLLEDSDVQIFKGYHSNNVPDDVDLVIIGNSVPYENVEVQFVEERSLPYSLFPKVLSELVIGERQSIVVSGTHGKTTTTAMVAHLLEKAGCSPSYFMGGKAVGFSASLEVGLGGISVVEGDEYSSAFFAKVPKFTFYRPDILVINSIEFDHADIYDSLEQIQGEFDKLVRAMPSGSTLLCSADDKGVLELLPGWKGLSQIETTTFGFGGDADVMVSCRPAESGIGYRVQAEREDQKTLNFALNMLGEYNGCNATAALLACEAAGVPMDSTLSHVSSFGGVARRQEIKVDTRDVTLIEDFAHHPTSVEQTVRSVSKQFPGRRLIAVFEPRSNTSRQEIFRKGYSNAFSGADRVLIADVKARAGDENRILMRVGDLVRDLQEAGLDADLFPDGGAIGADLLKERREGDVILVMSNGSFDGLVEELQRRLLEVASRA